MPSPARRPRRLSTRQPRRRRASSLRTIHVCGRGAAAPRLREISASAAAAPPRCVGDASARRTVRDAAEVVAVRDHGAVLGERRRVDVGVERLGHRELGEGGHDVGLGARTVSADAGSDGLAAVLLKAWIEAGATRRAGLAPAGLGRLGDEAVRLRARRRVHGPERRDAQRVERARAEPIGALAQRLGRRRRRERRAPAGRDASKRGPRRFPRTARALDDVVGCAIG